MNAAPGAGAARLLRAMGTTLPTGLGLLAAFGAITLLLRPEAWTVVMAPAGLALAWLAWVRPEGAVALLLAIAPICGNKPTTGPFLAFVTLTACAVPGWLARLASRDRADALSVLGGPTGLAYVAYAGASTLSLSSLPLYAPADIVGAASIGDAIRRLPAALAGAEINQWIYPVLTVVLTLHAAVAALTVSVALRREALDASPARALDTPTLVTGAILAGFVATIVAGALDRFGYLDLRLLRATDPYTNPSGAERLQSTFGHAGWLAQYVCFATPSILALWFWPAPAAAAATTAGTNDRRVARLVVAACLLAAALAAVVLSYQRGGWITWALIGSGVVAAAVSLASPERPAAPPRSPGRLVAVGAGALLVALALGLVVIRVAGGPRAMERFADRARTITQVSDRQAHVIAGLRFGGQLPVLGGGSESFALRYEQEYLRAGGAYYARGYSPVLDRYGSAHNAFVQTFAGKGVVGLMALLLLVGAAAAAAMAALRRRGESRRVRVVAAIALGTVAAFALYGQVQEVFYIPSLQLVVAVAGFALAAAIEPRLEALASARQRLGVVALLLAAGLVAHLLHGYVISGRLADEYRDRAITRAGERLSAPLLGDDGEYHRWTGRRAVVTVPRQATELSLELRRSSPAPYVVEVRFDDRLIDRVRLDDDGWRHVVYPLRRLRSLPRRLDLVVVTPAADAVGRGVAVRRMHWGMP